MVAVFVVSFLLLIFEADGAEVYVIYFIHSIIYFGSRWAMLWYLQ